MAIYTYLPRYLSELGINNSIIQLVSSISAFTNFLFPPIMGSYSDKIQKRYRLFIIGAISDTFLFIFLSFYQNLFLIITALFVHGFFYSAIKLTAILFQELVENDQKLISYLNAVEALGWFAGAQLCGIFVEMNGIDNLFIFALTFSIISTVTILFAKENRVKILERSKVLNGNQNPLNQNEENGRIIDKGEEMISNSVFYSLFFRHFGVRPILSILVIVMAIYLSSDVEIGFLMGINPLSQFFLMIVFGKIVNEKNQKHIIVIGYFLSSIGLVGYLLSTDFFGFLISQILVSLSYCMFYSALYFYISKNTSPKNKGKYIGYVNSGFFFGGFTGGIFVAGLLELGANYAFVTFIMIFLPLVSVLIILVKFK